MTRRILIAALVAVLAYSVSVSAQTASSGVAVFERLPGSGSQAALSAMSTVQDPAIAVLYKRVESVEWIDTPFEEVVDWIREESGGAVNVVPRWSAMGVEGVDRDTLVTLQLSNTTVAQVLNEALDALSEDGELRYRAVGNTLKISTRADFERKLYLRVYDATDILLRVPDFGRGAPVIDLQNTRGGGQGGGGQSVFSGSGGGQDEQTGGEQAEQELMERLEELSTMIREVIAPETWNENGGRGRIQVFNRSLIILASIEVHEAIAGPFSYGG